MLLKLVSNMLARPATPGAPPPSAYAPALAATTPPEMLTQVSAAPVDGVVEQAPSAAPTSIAEMENAKLLDDLYFRRRQLALSWDQAYYAGLQLVETLLAHPSLDDPKRLERFGGKTYSQNEEDGIIAEIFHRIGAPHRTFVEFGCGDGMENNTACLLSQGWRGLWMDGGEDNASGIQNAYRHLIERDLLQFRHVFIDRDNVNELIAQAGLGPEIDLLSIDLDGNDYHLWEAIDSVSARVVVIEYNAKFLPRHDWCMTYNPQHMWVGSDLMGCSLAGLARLGAAKGYRLVGCNITGSNAFFVRADVAGDRFAEPATPEHLYQPARYALSRCFVVGHPANTQTIVQGALAAAGVAWVPDPSDFFLKHINLP